MGLPPVDGRTVVHYAYDIKVRGKKVGTLQNFSPSSTRALERIREIAYSDIDTLEIAPGRTDHQLTVEKLEFYNKSLVEALGYELANIADLREPITIVETLHRPDGTKRRISYDNCWINTMGKTVTTGGVTVSENATLWATNVRILPE